MPRAWSSYSVAVFLLALMAVLPACAGSPVPHQRPTAVSIATATVEPAGAIPASPSPEPIPATRTTVTIPSQSPAVEIPGTQQSSPSPATTATSAGAPKPVYTLTATLDYDLHLLSVEEQIDYPNRSGEALPELLLLVEPSRYPDVFHLKEIRLDGGKPVENYEREIGLLRLHLPQPLPPGEKISVSLIYDLRLPSPDPSYYGRPVPFGYTARQTNLVDWYPFIPPYIAGQGWLYHPAGAFGEYLVYESADFEVSLRLEGTAQGVTIAASAPAEIDGEWQRYHVDSARNFTFSASQLYQVFTAQAGEISVTSYAFQIDAAAGQAALQTTVEALSLYAELFGPYPHRSLSVVEADFLDGMEFDGLYFLSKGFYNLYSGTQADYLTAIAAHETAHQWWYARIGNDQALEPWLDEALSTYCERIYYEKLHPEALSWWWDYRIRYYDPRGWVDGSIYNPEGYRAYRDAVYLNGALFLEDLRNLIGEDAFFKLLKDYAARYQDQIASGKDFFSLLSKVSPVDTSDLLHQYFKSPPP